jgi:hypothetical protein
MKEDFIVCYRYATHYKVAEDSIPYRLLSPLPLSVLLQMQDRKLPAVSRLRIQSHARMPKINKVQKSFL